MREDGSDGACRESREVYHGGDLASARHRFPTAPEPWLDLSTGINPIAYPFAELSAAAWTRLPDRAAIASLESAAAAAYGVRGAATVIAAPGEQALIQLTPHLAAAPRVGVLGFTYAEHEACWRASGAAVQTVEEVAALAAFDVAVIGGTQLFRLVRSACAAAWFEHLGRAGILARPFPARRDWLRFGLPGPEADWLRLERALRSGPGAVTGDP